MGRTVKVTPQEKLEAVEAYQKHQATLRSLGKQYGVHHSSVEKWLALYENFGAEGLYGTTHNHRYPMELKQKAVKTCLEQGRTLYETCREFKLRSPSQLQNWISQYEQGRLKGNGYRCSAERRQP